MLRMCATIGRDVRRGRVSVAHAPQPHVDPLQFEVSARRLGWFVNPLANFDLSQRYRAEVRNGDDVPEGLYSGNRNLADTLDQGTYDGFAAVFVIRVASTDELVDVGKPLIVLLL